MIQGLVLALFVGSCFGMEERGHSEDAVRGLLLLADSGSSRVAKRLRVEVANPVVQINDPVFLGGIAMSKSSMHRIYKLNNEKKLANTKEAERVKVLAEISDLTSIMTKSGYVLSICRAAEGQMSSGYYYEHRRLRRRWRKVVEKGGSLVDVFSKEEHKRLQEEEAILAMMRSYKDVLDQIDGYLSLK